VTAHAPHDPRAEGAKVSDEPEAGDKGTKAVNVSAL
jgi:cold shock CspA family protein